MHEGHETQRHQGIPRHNRQRYGIHGQHDRIRHGVQHRRGRNSQTARHHHFARQNYDFGSYGQRMRKHRAQQRGCGRCGIRHRARSAHRRGTKLRQSIKRGFDKGKSSSIIVLAEGKTELTDELTQKISEARADASTTWLSNGSARGNTHPCRGQSACGKRWLAER